MEKLKASWLPDWVVAPAGMLITTTIIGSFVAFNVFLKYLLDDFEWSRGGTAGALSAAMVGQGILSPLTGYLADKYGARPLVSVGAVLLGVGYLLLSQVQELWQLYALYLMTGMGGATVFVPVVGAVSRRFHQRRGLALSVGVSGITLGTAIVPLALSEVMSALGWRQTYMLVGVVIGLLVLSLGQLMGGRLPTASARRLSGYSLSRAIRTATFWKVLLASGTSLSAVHMVVAHMVTFSTDLGLAAAKGATLVSMVGICGFVGMIFTGYLADRFGGRGPWMLSALLSITGLAWLLVMRDPSMIYPFVALYGFAWGGYAVLMPFLAAQ
ncbi:MAG: MFS transporter, partial [Dehalococcoidia bacterium]|nr:MFS transporter [Dehalococcoidia bacterium]